MVAKKSKVHIDESTLGAKRYFVMIPIEIMSYLSLWTLDSITQKSNITILYTILPNRSNIYWNTF